MTNQFDATASMLGYIFQCRLALFDAVRRLKCRGSFSVSIEVLDDVAFEADGSPTELLQVKHRIARTGGLGDASPDLWKSLRIWAEGLANGRWPCDTVYYLVTTGSAQHDSAASYLRNDSQRNCGEACKRLEKVAQTSANKDNQAAYSVYLSLPPSDRLSMLEGVVVSDKSPDIIGVKMHLRKELALTVRREFVELLVARLEGWWFQRIMEHLRQTDYQPISSEELDAELNHLRQQFRDDNLPIDHDLLDAEIDESAFSSHVFVEQLRLIDLINRRIITAMRQYFRASEQRSRWLREGLIAVGELSRYDKRLFEEWDIRFATMIQDLGGKAPEDRMRYVGRELYGWAEREVSLPIRSRCYEPFVARGSLQMLADRCCVGWHPEFHERLRSLVKEEVS